MTIALDFAYAAPTSLSEAVRLLEDDRRALPLAGGTDLIVQLRDEAVAPTLLVDLKHIDELRAITVDEEGLRVGALVTFSDLLGSQVVRQRLPLLVEMAGTVASVGIRNRATVVGNICSAVPSCDAGPALLATGATVHASGVDGARRIPVGSWFTGPRRTALRPGELVTHLTIPVPARGSAGAFARSTRYRGEDLAQASVAVLVTPGPQVRIAFGAVAPTPVRAPRIEAFLREHGLGDTVLEEAVGLVGEEISPITDLRATRHYRLRMCEVLLRRAVAAARDRADGGGPPLGTRLL